MFVRRSINVIFFGDTWVFLREIAHREPRKRRLENGATSWSLMGKMSLRTRTLGKNVFG